jgi:hypothetical protein
MMRGVVHQSNNNVRLGATVESFDDRDTFTARDCHVGTTR